jgi:hypothetical protein
LLFESTPRARLSQTRDYVPGGVADASLISMLMVVIALRPRAGAYNRR